VTWIVTISNTLGGQYQLELYGFGLMYSLLNTSASMEVL
jgi:hypothetical protein